MKECIMQVSGKTKIRNGLLFLEFTKKNGDEIYQVRFIANNHIIAQYL